MKRISIRKNSGFIWLPALLLLVLFSISENEKFQLNNDEDISISAFEVVNSVSSSYADLEETEDFHHCHFAEIQLLNDLFFRNVYVIIFISRVSFHNKNQLNVTLFNLPPPCTYS